MHDLAKLNWDDLRLFAAVLRAGSFTQAARVLGTDQSTVTRRMRALESALGHTLFERRHDGLTPTQLCSELAAYAERLEADVHELLSAAHSDKSNEPAGRVRLATTESFAVHVLIPHLLAEFRATYPRIALDLVLGDLSADLMRREADIALRFYQPMQGDLVAKRLLDLPTAVLAHRDYPGCRRRRPEALDWIVHALPAGQSPDVAFLNRIGAVEPVLTTTSHLALVEAVRAGLGVALLARPLMQLAPELVEVPVELPELPSVPLWLVTLRSLRAVPRIDALWGFLETNLVAQLKPHIKRRAPPRA